tara:strand:- start:997 stop:1254 length:258 start_codon:yes stop_codon:yes gene_type:complete
MSKYRMKREYNDKNDKICATIYHADDVATDIVFTKSYNELGELAQIDVLKDIIDELSFDYNIKLQKYMEYLQEIRAKRLGESDGK